MTSSLGPPPDADVATAGLERLSALVRSRHPQLMALRERKEVGEASTEAANRQALLDRISNWLYADWYSRPDPPLREDPPRFRPGFLVSALRAALPAATRWQAGWVAMRSAANGACIAGRREEVRELQPGDYANVSRAGMPVMPGDGVAITARLDRYDVASGFWTARSSVGEPQRPLVRLYWAVGPTSVGPVLRWLASALDASGTRYSVKCPATVSGYLRVDTLVVYLEKTAWFGLAEVVHDVARSSRPLLRPLCPPLTLAIAHGVAYAEDPGPSLSFGQHRCRALAPAVLGLLDDGAGSPEADVARLKEALAAAQIDAGRPWLCSIQ